MPAATFSPSVIAIDNYRLDVCSLLNKWRGQETSLVSDIETSLPLFKRQFHHKSEVNRMNDSFQQITINPSLPCVYHDCDGQATTAIAYAVSEREWRMVPTC